MKSVVYDESLVRSVYDSSSFTYPFENLMEELSFIQEKQSERADVWLERVHDPKSAVALAGVDDDGIHYFVLDGYANDDEPEFFNDEIMKHIAVGNGNYGEFISSLVKRVMSEKFKQDCNYPWNGYPVFILKIEDETDTTDKSTNEHKFLP